MMKKEQDEPSLNRVEMQPDATDRVQKPSIESLILTFLDSQDHPVSPKEIAHRIKKNHNTIKSSLRRLAQKHLLQSDASGYFLPKKNIYKELEKELLFNGQKGSLPKVHDIQLLFKPANLRISLSQYQETGKFFNGFGYDEVDTEPDNSEIRQPLIPRRKTIPSVSKHPTTSSDDHYLSRFFNPLDPMSIYQLWDRKKVASLSGGFQEVFKMPDYRLSFQFYGTGSIQITVHNSEKPFDYNEFNQFLNVLDGIFVSRTNISFKDIGVFFYVDQIHFNSDVLGDRAYHGMSRLNLTAQVMDDFMMRIYEKVLGKDLYIRQEYCLQKGNIQDHNLNSVLALLMGGVQPAITTAQIFKTSKDQEAMVDVIKQLARQTTAQGKQIEALAQMIRGMSLPPSPPPATPTSSPPVADAPSIARKAHSSAPRLEDYLGQVRCPRCRRAMQETPSGYVCPGCGSGVSA